MLERFPILAIRSGENLKRRDLQQMSGRYHFKKFLLTSSNSVNIRYHQGHVNHCKPKGFERFSQMDKVGFGEGAPEQKINFCLKWSKRVQMVPNGQQHLGWPLWYLLDPLERWQACHVWPVLVQNGPFLGHPQSCTVDPRVKKKAHHHVSYVWAACGTPIIPFWNINMAAIHEKCQK